MAIEVYYIRHRGRVTGPYDMEELEALARSGRFSRIHEISTDRVSWHSAGKVLGMFVDSHRDNAQEAVVLGAAPEPSNAAIQPELITVGSVETGSPRSSEPDRTYYYSHGGKLAGPIALNELEQLVAQRIVGAADHVWRNIDAPPLPAASVPELAHYFHHPIDPRPQTSSTAAMAIAGFGHADSSLTRRETLMTAAGITASIVLLVCLSLPFGRGEDGIVWWWSIYSSHRNVALMVACAFLLLIGCGIGLVAGLMRAQPRNMAYLGVSILGILLGASFAIALPGYGLVLATESLSVSAGVVLLSVLVGIRGAEPAKTASLVVVAAAMFLALGLAALMTSLFSSGDGANPITAVFVLITSIATFLFRLSAAITALLFLRRPAHGLWSASIVLIILSLVFAVALELSWGSRALVSDGMESSRRFAVMNAVRGLVAFGALQMLLGIGLYRQWIGPRRLAFDAHIDV